MHFMVGLVFAIVGILFVQSTPVVRQVDNVDLIESLVDIHGRDLFDQLDDILLPEEMKSFKQDFIQLIAKHVNSGSINSDAFQLKVENLMTQYLRPYMESRFDFQYLAQPIVNAVAEPLPTSIENTFDKRQATDAILAAAPELSVLIDPLNEALDQFATFLLPDQLQSLREQALQLILSAAAGNINMNQLQSRLQALLQQYLNFNGRSQIDIDNIIQQVVATDTAGLPNVIINFLGKHDTHDDH